jgi:hypothetical protein
MMTDLVLAPKLDGAIAPRQIVERPQLGSILREVEEDVRVDGVGREQLTKERHEVLLEPPDVGFEQEAVHANAHRFPTS